MKNRFLILILCGLVCTFVGCGSKADRIVKKQIKLVNKLADKMEDGGSDEELKKISDQLTDLEKELEELDLTSEEKEALRDKYKDDMTKARKRLAEAAVAGAMKRFGESRFGKGGFGDKKRSKGAPGLPSF